MLKASGNVFISVLVQETNGHKKLFHAPTNVKIANASTEDFTIGNTILKKMRKFPHPSIFAALIRSSGTSRIACRMINTPNAVGNGRINALNVFSHPRFFTIKNNGTMITSDGTIIVKIKSKNNLSFPLKFNFANAYPASEHTITVKITPTTATYTLLNQSIRIDHLETFHFRYIAIHLSNLFRYASKLIPCSRI